MAEMAKKHQLIIEYENVADLRAKLKEEQRNLIGTRTFDVFRPVAIQNEEIIAINKQYFTEDDFDKTMLEPLRAIYVAEGKFLTESTIHESLKKIALNVFGVTKNKDLMQEQLPRVQEVYRTFKEVFLYLYEERVSKLVKER
ncbi:hypothetical protein [Enterococcus faecium]|uniref:hypothetical protein n=1 Tax=Enterococcus faecium TaxID=1352 RepID=UPI000CF28555|nr:hypothetical protein [Enterococcus faecium]EGP4986060.1 hypothetical protein [Enterococcus faecium]EGP5088028.1 hypothetical protein [Enterococcus faecium]EGP5129997.1 hypothetical protein [Enterococcus faecium]EGP5140129.1 hypothetical protein [Enterococcus faecium]EME3512033.1 hypothetical protein [Enterococcus faecium]